MHLTSDVLALSALGETIDPAATEHLAECPQCRTELAALRHVVEVGRTVTAEDVLVEPSGAVWQRVRAGIDASRDSRVIQLPGSVALAAPPRADEVPAVAAASELDERRARRAQQRWRVVALAAAVALVVGLGAGFGISRLLTPDNDVVGVTTLNALPQWPGSNGTAKVEKDAQGNRTLVVTVEVPPTEHVDGVMEVWLSDTRANDMVSMGFMPGTAGRFAVPPTMNLDSHPIVDVSVEPRDDKNPKHSLTSVVRGRLAV